MTFLGVDESTVAIVVMATMLLLGIVTWEDVVKNKGGLEYLNLVRRYYRIKLLIIES
ncbi:anion permease [Escherichia coli]